MAVSIAGGCRIACPFLQNHRAKTPVKILPLPAGAAAAAGKPFASATPGGLVIPRATLSRSDSVRIFRWIPSSLNGGAGFAAFRMLVVVAHRGRLPNPPHPRLARKDSRGR